MHNFDELNNSVGFYIGFTASAIKNELIKRLSEKGHDITHAQWMILMMLWAKDGRNQNELTGLMYKEKTTITRVIEVMERRGLIFREVDPNDKRNKICYLTEQSNELKDKVIPEVINLNVQAAQNISNEELAHFKSILKKILANINFNNSKLKNC